jgi:hypothetical protein
MANNQDKALIGAAGEHLVLSRLLSQGFLAALAPRGARKADVLVNFLDGGQPFLVQVKATVNPAKHGWPLQQKHELERDGDLFFCFVTFSPEHPDVYVLPSAVVADHCSRSHEHWMDTPGRNGQRHNDSNMRRIGNSDWGHGRQAGWLDEYLEDWESFAR